jgi:hypothetical protein
MPTKDSSQRRPAGGASAELARRLRGRARRAKVLRRRIVALTVALFVAAWSTVYVFGYLGSTATTATALAQARTAAVLTRRGDTAEETATGSTTATRTSTTTTTPTSTSTSNGTSSSAATVTPVTTSQS